MIEVLHLPTIPRRHATITRQSKFAQPELAADILPDITVVNGWQIFPGLPSTPTTASFDGGGVVVEPRCAVLFYGSAWENPNTSPDAATLLDAFGSVINSSPYLDALMIYGIGAGAVMVGQCRIVHNDPPNPFSQSNGSDVVKSMIDAYYSKLDPREQPNMYSVILPPGVAFVSDDSRDSGYHAEGDGNYFAVVLNGPIDQMTNTFTHEFVETATDPTGDAWQVEPRNDSSWNEVCDVCETAPVTYVNGVAVAPYFANYVGGSGCLVPLPPPPPVPVPPPPVLPNGDYLITNAQFASSSGIDYVAEIGGPIGAGFWRLGIKDAIARMKHGELTFYTMSDGERADVHIGQSLLSPYLTTASDDTKLNNLDYLAAHDPVPLVWTLYQ